MQKVENLFEVESNGSEVVLHELRLTDRDVVSILRECKDQEEVEEVVKQGLKIGLMVTRNAQTIENIDYVEKNFLGFSHQMEQQFDGLSEDVANYFGPKGSVTALFDTTNKKSIATKLLDDINKQIQDLLSVSSDSSALGQLRKDLETKFTHVNDILNQLIGKKTESIKGSQKGLEFEELLFDYLERSARITGDTIEKTGTIAKGRDKKGDLLVKIHDSILQDGPVIVIEAKDTTTISVDGKNGLMEQVQKGMINRSADFGIGVVKNIGSLPGYIGPLRFYPDKQVIICSYGEDGLPFELAYIFARNLLLRLSQQEVETEDFDIEGIQAVFKDINIKLKLIRNMKKNMTEIDKLTKSTRLDLELLDASIKDLVDEGLDLLQSPEYDE